jgi:hypothetical protein
MQAMIFIAAKRLQTSIADITRSRPNSARGLRKSFGEG